MAPKASAAASKSASKPAGSTRRAKVVRGKAAAHKASKACPRQSRWSALLCALDKSGDGMLDLDEFGRAVRSFADCCPQLNVDTSFAHWDGDGNGFLTVEEFSSFVDAIWQVLGEQAFGRLENVLLASQDAPNESTPALPGTRPRRPSVDAADHLSEACASGDIKVLRKAIHSARSANVDATLLESSLQRLGQLEAESLLVRAAGTKDSEVVKLAVQQARQAGVDHKRIDEVLSSSQALTSEDQRVQQERLPAGGAGGTALNERGRRESKDMDAALKALQQAARGGSGEELKLAIDKARNYGVDEAKVLEAEGLQSRMFAKQELDRALESAKRRDIQLALQRARQAGVAEHHLERAEGELETLEASIELYCAIEERDLRKLKQHVDKARRCNVEDNAIARGEALIQELEATQG